MGELTQRLNVSDMTVRRDLDTLARQSLLAKVHGGAVPVSDPSSHEPGFEAKSALETTAKDAIADAAAELAQPGSAVALSGGTTTYALAQRLVDVEGLTVVTNSVRVADLFDVGDPRSTSVVLTGGARTPSAALVGPIADRTIRSLHFDVLFLGCHGVSAEAGLSTPNLAEAETNRCFVESARRVVVVADHTKWGTVGLSGFAALEQVDYLVTDSGMGLENQEVAAEHVGELIVAP